MELGLFLADGLIDLAYSPRDIVLLDGNVPHGVTSLRALKAEAALAGRAERERFLVIVFSKFARADRMRKHGNFSVQWNEKEWRPKVVWK